MTAWEAYIYDLARRATRAPQWPGLAIIAVAPRPVDLGITRELAACESERAAQEGRQ